MPIKQIIITFILSISLVEISIASESQQMKGVNLAGAEFNNSKIPGRYAFDYIWPTSNDIDRFARAGFTVIRVPFLWERMQPNLGAELDKNELKKLDESVDAAKKNKIKIILDLHNYGLYKGSLIGTDIVKTEQYVDFWERIAVRYKDYPNVIFGLMNEPYKQSASDWAIQAQAAINSIRAVNARQLILVPGTRWTGAHSWITSGNAEALATIKDPVNNYAFDIHQYFDGDSSGNSPICVHENIGIKRLEAATKWLNESGHHAFLGEFGASTNPICIKTLDNTLAYLSQNKNVWIGWSYWAAGPWWGDYMFSIDSLNTQKDSQFSVIDKYLKKTSENK